MKCFYQQVKKYPPIKLAIHAYNEMQETDPQRNSEYLMERIVRHLEIHRTRRNRDAISRRVEDENKAKRTPIAPAKAADKKEKSKKTETRTQQVERQG